MIRFDSFDIRGHYVQFGSGVRHWNVHGCTLLEVTPESSRTLRRAVYRFARYFRMEEDYDFVQYGYDGEEDDPTCRAYLTVAADSHRSGTAFGAFCFRAFETKAGEKWNAMCWAWLHPFNRRRGVLKESLPIFQALHPGFIPETPWSPAIREFVGKYMPETMRLFAKGSP